MGKSYNYFSNLPESCNPEKVGYLLSSHFIKDGKHMLHMGKWISYPETFVWEGALEYAYLTHHKQLLDSLEHRFIILLVKEKNLLPPMYHVDMNMFGSLPLLLYQITGKTDYLTIGIKYAETQWTVPATATSEQREFSRRGYSWQSRLWIDDMYMITILQVEAFKATKNPVYMDRAAKEMSYYLEHLQCSNGLFYHASDVPYYWGRGNGWVAAGMVELLKILPFKNKYRDKIMSGYKKMMKSLRFFRNAGGLWNQLIDRNDCWTETSGSAMFTYSMITGVKKGWLNPRIYGPVARKAWITMVSFLNSNGDVRNVCAGTNKKNDLQYYYDRPQCTGDYHGQAPYLWCVNALLDR